MTLALAMVAGCGSTDQAASTGQAADSSQAAKSSQTGDSSPAATSDDTATTEQAASADQALGTDRTGVSPADGPADATDPSRTLGPDGTVSQLCQGLQARPAGKVGDGQLNELSGLAASQAHPGVLWAHNDSGHKVVLFAVGSDGADLGSFPVPGVEGIDIEDIALANGMVYLADTGDNDQNRSQVSIYRFPEPDPRAKAGPVSGVEVLRFRYPDRPHDAEALMVDPTSGQIIVVTKEYGFAGFGRSGAMLRAVKAPIFVADPPFEPSKTVTFQAAGTVPLDWLATRTTAVPAPGQAASYGLGGVITGADVSADGRVVALRTYATIWLFDRPAGITVADVLSTGWPCEAPSQPESQGEAVAVLPGPDLGLATASEGSHPELTLIQPG